MQYYSSVIVCALYNSSVIICALYDTLDSFHKFQQCMKKANAHSVSNVNILKVTSGPNTNASFVVFNCTWSFLDAVKYMMMTKLKEIPNNKVSLQ